MAELFEVLADQLHAIVPFDYLALLLHDEPTNEMRLVVLEPADIVPPFLSAPVAEQGPAATVWETQQGTVIVIPEEGPLPPGPVVPPQPGAESRVLAAADDRAPAGRRPGLRQPFPGALHR